MRTSLRFLVLLLGLFALSTGAGFAGEKIWVGLYMAENAPPAPNTVLAPERLHHQLREVFGFKHYEFIKAKDIELRNDWEQWFIPRRDFFIRLEPLRRQMGEPKCIYYEIYNGGFIMAKGRFEPHEATPLFINGPDFHQGRLIFVLEAR